MSLLKTLKYWLTPLKMTDLDFGTLTFIYVSQNPERSYWECEWRFPSTGTVVLITLDGDRINSRYGPDESGGAGWGSWKG